MICDARNAQHLLSAGTRSRISLWGNLRHSSRDPDQLGKEMIMYIHPLSNPFDTCGGSTSFSCGNDIITDATIASIFAFRPLLLLHIFLRSLRWMKPKVRPNFLGIVPAVRGEQFCSRGSGEGLCPDTMETMLRFCHLRFLEGFFVVRW